MRHRGHVCDTLNMLNVDLFLHGFKISHLCKKLAVAIYLAAGRGLNLKSEFAIDEQNQWDED